MIVLLKQRITVVTNLKKGWYKHSQTVYGVTA